MNTGARPAGICRSRRCSTRCLFVWCSPSRIQSCVFEYPEYHSREEAIPLAKIVLDQDRNLRSFVNRLRAREQRLDRQLVQHRVRQAVYQVPADLSLLLQSQNAVAIPSVQKCSRKSGFMPHNRRGVPFVRTTLIERLAFEHGQRSLRIRPSASSSTTDIPALPTDRFEQVNKWKQRGLVRRRSGIEGQSGRQSSSNVA